MTRPPWVPPPHILAPLFGIAAGGLGALYFAGLGVLSPLLALFLLFLLRRNWSAARRRGVPRSEVWETARRLELSIPLPPDAALAAAQAAVRSLPGRPTVKRVESEIHVETAHTVWSGGPAFRIRARAAEDRTRIVLTSTPTRALLDAGKGYEDLRAIADEILRRHPEAVEEESPAPLRAKS